MVGVLSVPSKNNPARFSGRFTYKKDFRKHLLRFLKSFSIYRSNEHSLYCRHGSISHFIYDQIQDQQVVFGCLAFVWWEWAAVFAFVPIFYYNGKRGFGMKYFFYAFYPVHLLILYLIVYKMGYGSVPAI